MKVENVSVSELSQDERNARLHNDRNLKIICNSLERFGQQKPIVVDAEGVVIAGNGTLQAACLLGWEKIRVVRTKLKGEDVRAYALADNRTTDLSEWHFNTLIDELGELDESLVEAIGWNPDEIANLIDVPERVTEDNGDFKFSFHLKLLRAW